MIYFKNNAKKNVLGFRFKSSIPKVTFQAEKCITIKYSVWNFYHEFVKLVIYYVFLKNMV